MLICRLPALAGRGRHEATRTIDYDRLKVRPRSRSRSGRFLGIGVAAARSSRLARRRADRNGRYGREVARREIEKKLVGFLDGARFRIVVARDTASPRIPMH